MKSGLAQGQVGARVIKEHQAEVCVVAGIGQQRVGTAVGNNYRSWNIYEREGEI